MQARSVKFRFALRPLAALLACALVAPAVLAENLQDIFQLAANKDPEIRQARARYNASHTQLDQGRSYLLPTISATGAMSRDASGTSQTYSFDNQYTSKSYGLSLQQAVFNMEAWYSFQSAKRTDEQAALTLAQAEQQLIIKVATAYFNVLRSQANLASFDAELQAARQTLDSVQQKFDVGLVTITDLYDAQANADLASVNKLGAENSLSQGLEALEAITGQPAGDLSQLNDNFPIVPAEPANVKDWVSQAGEKNLAIRIAHLDRDAREQDLKAAKASLYPTVSLGANYSWSQSANTLSFFPGLANESSRIGLNITIPLYTGGLKSARLHQANYNLDSSSEGLTKSERDNLQTVRNSYRSVDTDVKTVAARGQALKSAQAAFESTQVSAEVGTRNIVDVVNAQRTLFQTQRDYANARFSYVIDTLTLKQAAGVLSPPDVIQLNQWLHQ